MTFPTFCTQLSCNCIRIHHVHSETAWQRFSYLKKRENKLKIMLYLQNYKYKKLAKLQMSILGKMLIDDCLMTSWWLPDDFLMTAWWLPDDCLMTVWRQLRTDLLMTYLKIPHCASGLFQKASLFMPKYKMTLLHS